MKKNIMAVLITVMAMSTTSCRQQDYHDSSLSPDLRASLLLREMTLDEKVAQLYCVGEQTFIHDESVSLDSLKEHLPHGTGIIFANMYGNPIQYAAKVNAYQHYLVEETRLGIPAMFGAEGLHGFMAEGTTYFPQAIALGCTFDTQLVESVFAAAAREMRSRGVTQVLSPVVDLARDPRWGRTEECFSEDPWLVAQMGLAAVRGFQGHSDDDLRTGNHVIATLKHFVGHGQPEGGRNIAPVATNEQDVRENHMHPFEVCVREGHVRSVMASYNDLAGVPNHANRWLLTDVLRHEWGFDGYVIGDAGGVDELFMLQHVAVDEADAARQALDAGVDFELVRHINTYTHIPELVNNGRLDIKVLDRAVKAILTEKFRLGLFENPYTDLDSVVIRPDSHRRLARTAAQESIVLLQNTSSLVPLDLSALSTIAVIGPNAAGVHLGAYTSDPHEGVSVVEGIRRHVGNRIRVTYAEGCRITHETPSFWGDNETPETKEVNAALLREAVATAAAADVVVLVVGDNVSTCREAWAEHHRGDRDDLSLLGEQNALVNALLATGTPIVALVLGGRPLAIGTLSEGAGALFQGFYMGAEGGDAFADILFGDVSPSGRLSISMPRNVGQLPVYYNHKPSLMRSYLWSDTKPLYPFGHGLTYTTFEYSGLQMARDTIGKADSVKLSFNLRNTGTRQGTETVQCYIRDDVASTTRPVMALRDWQRVTLAPGNSERVVMTITPEMLQMYNREGKRLIEEGTFTLMVGPSSEVLPLQTVLTVAEQDCSSPPHHTH